jgi:SAM-dependent methyltransferase/aminoglycoside phosphotransferase (APT) family kinase protein
MKTQSSLQLPENTCAYERYDPATLEPVNSETFVRLQELGWRSEDFSGKTVLDIGCNSGLLTMYALRLGAAKVHACDVQPLLVEFVTQVVATRKLPVKVTQTAFNDLKPDRDKADIVLFMEVLHWAVSQGLELRRVIQQLAQLTGAILYIEFPWSVKEPSIQNQTKLTEERYSADAVLDELTRHFADVRVVRFMRYFGFESQSVRVLIEARGKRRETDVLLQLPKVYSLDVALSRGRNESYLLTSARGPMVAKLLAPECTLATIPESLCNRMFDEISANRPGTLVMPEKIQDSYLLTSSEGKRWMVFPFVSRFPTAGKMRPANSDIDRLIDLFVDVRRDLRRVSADLLDSLRKHRVFVSVGSLASPDAQWLTNPGELEPIRDSLLEAIRGVQNLDSRLFDGLCHGDLQTGNFVLDERERVRVVDLDSICIGPIYSDGLLGLIWRGGSEAVLTTFCERIRQEEFRPVNREDVTVAIARGLMWFSAVRSGNANPVIQEQISRLTKGLTNARAFSASLPATVSETSSSRV